MNLAVSTTDVIDARRSARIIAVHPEGMVARRPVLEGTKVFGSHNLVQNLRNHLKIETLNW